MSRILSITAFLHGGITMDGFSEVAINAIIEGIQREDTIADLVFLGLPLRIINLLEDSLEIIYLKDLMNQTKQKLLEQCGFDLKTIKKIFDVLSRYHLLGQYKESYLEIDRKRIQTCYDCPNNSKTITGKTQCDSEKCPLMEENPPKV